MPAVYMDPAWMPDSRANNLPLERAWLIGTILTGVGYGVVVTLTMLCLGPLFKEMQRQRNRRAIYIWRVVFLVYVVLIFICATLFMAGVSTMAQFSFIDYRNFPGGPGQFQTIMFSIPVSEIGNVAFVVSNWLADLVIVWRCLVVYRGSRVPFWIICTIPCMTFATSWTLGLLWLIQVSASDSSPWSTSTVNFTQPYFWTSFALNVTMTIAIVARLLSFRYKIAKVLGSRHGRQYTSIAAIIVESSFLYTSFQLIFNVLFGLGNAFQPLFLQPLCQVQCIAPLLVIFRVSTGRAWTSETSTDIFKTTQTSSMEFSGIKIIVPNETGSFTAAPNSSPSLKVYTDEGRDSETVLSNSNSVCHL